MAAGKNPYHRYHIINACFTNKQKRYWTKQELIDKLEEYDFIVSERTINFDLENMRHDKRLKFFAPIVFCRKERAYYYSDPDYAINAVQLDDEQRRAFVSVFHLLEPYKNFKIVHEFKGAIEKILRVVDELTKDAKPSPSIIEFEKAPYHIGIEYLDVIQHAIENKQALCIAYQKFHDDTTSEHVFHPYLVKESKGLWYVLGYSDARNHVITLALDRIEKIGEATVAYKINTTIKANHYFKHTVGITHAQGAVEDIAVWFSPKLSPYIKIQPLHQSQHTVQDDQRGLVINLQLVINQELVALLLSYCPDVRVIKPLSLKNKFEELLKKGLEVSREGLTDGQRTN